PAGLALLDTDLKFTKINTAMPRLIGLASADWIGRLAQEALPDHVWRQVEHASRGALEDGVRKRVQIDLALGGDEGKPDEVRTILWNCSPVFAAEGGSPLGLNVVVQDVTDLHRKEQLLAAQKAELERQQSELNRRNEQLEEVNERAEAANQNLAETSGRLRSLLAGAPVGFGFFDRTARLVQHNAQLTSMTGLGDKRSRIDDTDDPSLMEEIRQHLRRVFATGHPVIGTELGASLPHDGMGPRWFLASFFPAGEPLDGEVAAAPGGDPAMDEVESFRTVGCVLLDITDRKRSERMLREAKENAINARISADRARELAEQANRAKSEFLAVLSHELRTPLTPVVAGAQMLASVVEKQHDLESEDTRSMIVETLDTMRRNVELEVRLIDDLLDLTRIARGKLQLTRRPSDLNEVVQHAVDICEQDVFDKRLDLKLDVTSKPLGTVVDPARIQQVVWNLIKNAVKFTEAEGCIAVRTFIDDDGRSVCCSVTDDGLGIEQSRLRSIFDAFEQGGPGMNRTFGGLGLGLAISRHLADAHGGSLVAHSEGLGRGATFTLRLPAKSLRQRGPSFNAPDAKSDLSVGRILLVEDHDDTSKLMSRFLQLQFEATVVRAGSVGEGRRLFDEQSFDLIISDIGLPDGNGTDLLSSLPHNHPPAIALSGYGTETDVRRSREAGFSEHLVKPVDLEQLESTVRKLVNGR
ncbi:MAG: ATP-binding protein, partial [Planctomycetota bacterium]